MRKNTSLCILFILLACRLSAQQSDYRSQVLRYIIRFRDIAVKEMQISGIPASITLAQGILESNAGQSLLATAANNHFGIKCHKEWTGEKYFKDDDKPNECFRLYATPEESYRDHSSFLVQRDRYRPLFQLQGTDYKGWAQGLKKAGYATNPKYADQLIRTIETYSLYKFDRGDFGAAFVDSINYTTGDYSKLAWVSKFEVVRVTPDNHRVFLNNKLLLTVVIKGDDLKSLAAAFNVTEKRLRRYNDLAGSRVEPGQIIYLQSKRRKASVDTHTVRQGETLYEISQGYGIKLKMLRKRNNIPGGLETTAGRLLRLR
jgi:hypothetical protein